MSVCACDVVTRISESERNMSKWAKNEEWGENMQNIQKNKERERERMKFKRGMAATQMKGVIKIEKEHSKRTSR